MTGVRDAAAWRSHLDGQVATLIRPKIADLVTASCVPIVPCSPPPCDTELGGEPYTEKAVAVADPVIGSSPECEATK